MPSQPLSKLENGAIDDVVRGWRSWARERGLDPDQPSRIDLHAFARLRAQRTGEGGSFTLPILDVEDQTAQILEALALRGFCISTR
jgi:hypothetical protein